MSKILGIVSVGIVSSLVLIGTSWALPDRSALSFDENATINYACTHALKQGSDAFQACVAQQVAALPEHPTPDRSGLTRARTITIDRRCGFLRNIGIGQYNDCLKQAIAAPEKPSEKAPDDDLAVNYAKVFTADADADAEAGKPAAVPVVAASLPLPVEALPGLPTHVADKILAPSDVFKKVGDAVFVVVATQSMAEARARNFMQGSAVAISDHLLLTNCHVVKNRPKIKIFQGDKSAKATLVGADMATDRCVLKTDDLTLTPITGVRAVDTLAVGERVFAIGTPISFERTLSEGLISALRKTSRLNMVQTSAPISPGSSGGGLFDERGNLIGITTLGSVGVAHNLNFAIAAADFWK
jgi:Trypsin-like peptidase domain